jgi:hypothetical protein
MEENILGRMSVAGLCGMISICIFVAFFTGMLLWAFLQKKNDLDRIGSLPLDGETNPNDKIQA